MSDLIDREQAKDAIDKYLVGRNLVTDGTFMARLINEIVIDRLPSAQPTFDARDTQYNLPIGTDLISRQAAIDAAQKWFDGLIVGSFNGLKKKLEAVPSAQPKPKRGRWERHYSRPNVYADLFWHCSECGYRSSDNWADKFNFCPHCGAMMEK